MPSQTSAVRAHPRAPRRECRGAEEERGQRAHTSDFRRAEHDSRGRGERLPDVAEDSRETWQNDRDENGDRQDARDGDDERIRERAAHGGAHVGGGLGQIRRAANRRSEAGAGFAGLRDADHEPRDLDRRVRERRGQRSTFANRLTNLRKRVTPPARRELFERVQRASGREPRIQQIAEHAQAEREVARRQCGARRCARGPRGSIDSTSRPRDAIASRASRNDSAAIVPRSSDPSRATASKAKSCCIVSDEGATTGEPGRSTT